jgi:hypothetical protein
LIRKVVRREKQVAEKGEKKQDIAPQKGCQRKKDKKKMKK